MASLLQSEEAFAWTNLGGGDHGGAAWTPPNGTLIGGNHTNVGDFTVAPGTVVYVQPYDGSGAYGLGNYGTLTVRATKITVSGTLTAAGSGWGGGGGGGGGTGGNGPYNKCGREEAFTGEFAAAGVGTRGGANGAKGSKNYPVAEGRSYGGAGGAGGGPCKGGAGAGSISTDSDGRRAGGAGVGATKCQNDQTVDETLYMGSGGGGGGGGSHSYEPMHGSIGGSGGGGAGGSGGGTIKLITDGAMVITGVVQATGRAGGGPGGLGTNGAGGSFTAYGCDLQGIGGAGGSAAWNAVSGAGGAGEWGYYNSAEYNECIKQPCRYSSGLSGTLSALYDKSYQGGAGGNGGIGGGGSIMLKADTMLIQGLVDTRGGSNSTAAGGTVKLFYCDTPSVTGTIAPGYAGAVPRLVQQPRTDCYVDIGLRVFDGSNVIAIAAKKGKPSPVMINYNSKAEGDLTLANYGLAVVDAGHARASKVGVQTATGAKRLRICGYPVPASSYVATCLN